MNQMNQEDPQKSYWMIDPCAIENIGNHSLDKSNVKLRVLKLFTMATISISIVSEAEYWEIEINSWKMGSSPRKDISQGTKISKTSKSVSYWREEYIVAYIPKNNIKIKY